jgi:excisionase family DNA binding protein
MASRDGEVDRVPGRRAYSVEEAAEQLGIGRTYMYHLLATGEVESFTIGKRRKVRPEALDAYLERLGTQKPARRRRRIAPADPGPGGPGGAS